MPNRTPEEISRALMADGVTTVSLTENNDNFSAPITDALSQADGQPGYLDLWAGNDAANLIIDQSAHGKLNIFGGAGRDSVVIRTADGNATLKQIDTTTAELAVQTAAGVATIRLEHVEDIQVQSLTGKLQSTLQLGN
jgi:hypothetical protein